ncbi:MAG TPA: SDR family oxidoreductase [Thermoanaerobaculia bacterium]|jgi:NAD(P)-dependent dehydrogenase (short-subunit alcohol dehydrogenase family)|nr:SDR family oxidoreductase [Thermoanaerobaculia bacterium]
MSPFQDAVVIVTGGASGLGRALCEETGRRGAVVVVTDVDEAGARAVADGIAAAGGRASAAALDVGQGETFQRVVEETVAAHGRLDYLFNNAGLAVVGQVQELTPEHWRKILNVNLLGVVHGVAAAYPIMVRQGSGHIVNTASAAGLLGIPLSTPYATTKSAVVGLSQNLRAEAADLGVKVSALCPAYIQTRIFDAATYAAGNPADALRLVPFKFLPVDDAVRRILRGVERNQGLIVLPFYARLFWWLTRLWPALPVAVNRRAVRGWRRRYPPSGPTAKG